jgi:RNA polymerase sigma-70 factor (ECF subfamily)
MVETPETERATTATTNVDDPVRMSEVQAWFIREVLPLESVLMQFLSRSGRSKTDAEDICQDVYMRVCATASEEMPKNTRALVFTIARNLLINRVKREQVISIETVENLDVLDIAIDEPAPDRVVIAREELRRLQRALEKLPERIRNIVMMSKVDGLSNAEIAVRTGTSERTVRRDLAEGVRALAEILLREPADIRRAS